MRLILPLPPARNAQGGRTSPKAAHWVKRRYQTRAWVAAVQQQRPTLDPPAKVRVTAHFKIYGPLRDDDGLDMKWVLDALKQKQKGSLAWRLGLFDQCGYFVDDDPSRLELEKPTQVIDRKDRCLVLTITEV